MSKIGLVLEGGAMRGMYTAGVIDVMLEQGIDVDRIIGVSAGAAFGCNYKSKQIGRVLKYNLEYCDDPRYMGIKSLVKTGDFFNRDFAYNKVPYEYHPFDLETYQNNPVEFHVVVTDVATGKPVYRKLEKGDQSEIDWIRASASMPLISKPVKIENCTYLDGGISDPIPFEWMQSSGVSKSIVVLTQTKGYQKKPSNSRIIKLLLRKYPKIATALTKRSELYNQQLLELQQAVADKTCYTINPSIDLHIKRIEKDRNKLQAMYDLGRDDTLNQLEEIITFINS